MFKVIFACVHNAGRSQMAAAFFNQLADPTKAQAVSAGTEPGTRVHPEVQAMMQEVGIDLSNAEPQKLTEELARDAQLLITMGCGDKCPYVACGVTTGLFAIRRDYPRTRYARFVMTSGTGWRAYFRSKTSAWGPNAIQSG
jgi:protein-tyrosine-phosphatase